jgi:hypothetical protein
MPRMCERTTSEVIKLLQGKALYKLDISLWNLKKKKFDLELEFENLEKALVTGVR